MMENILSGRQKAHSQQKNCLNWTAYARNEFQRSCSHIAGFTLIEILVVIAIIALLAAILFPVFGRARENARRSSCQSNLKQLALGITQYTQDYDETFPLLEDGDGSGMFLTGTPSASAPHQTWCDRLLPYLKSQQLFSCPSVGNAQNGALTQFSHYGLTAYLERSCNGDLRVAGRDGIMKLSEVARPSEVILMSDYREAFPHSVGVWSLKEICFTSASYITTPGLYSGMPLTTETCGGGFDCELSPVDDRHLNGANYAFFDGHVKWLGIQSIANGRPNGVQISQAYGPTGVLANGYPAIDWNDYTNQKVKLYWAPHL